jgi:hypothetical protein
MIWLAAFIRSPLGRCAVLASVLALLIGWASLERMGRQAANARADAAEAEVAARDSAIAALEQAAAESAARHAKMEPIRRAVANAPASNACADSAPVRAALDGLRAAQGGGARQPASVPAPARP